MAAEVLHFVNVECIVKALDPGPDGGQKPLDLNQFGQAIVVQPSTRVAVTLPFPQRIIALRRPSEIQTSRVHLALHKWAEAESMKKREVGHQGDARRNGAEFFDDAVTQMPVVVLRIGDDQRALIDAELADKVGCFTRPGHRKDHSFIHAIASLMY